MKEQTPVSPQIQAASSISADAVAFRALPKNNLYSESLQHFPIQRKLSVGAIDDPLEYEADAMADRVMRTPDSSFIQRKCAQCEDEEAQRKPLNSFIQKKGTEGKNTASNAVYNQIQSTKGGGTSMPEATKSFMESRFETDFSNVRIHSGEYASQLSNELNAQAFTVGNDIYFNSGKFSPESAGGRHLLAHELTHTLQQKHAIVQRKPSPAINTEECVKQRGGDLLPGKVGLVEQINRDVLLTDLLGPDQDQFKKQVIDNYDAHLFVCEEGISAMLALYYTRDYKKRLRVDHAKQSAKLYPDYYSYNGIDAISDTRKALEKKYGISIERGNKDWSPRDIVLLGEALGKLTDGTSSSPNEIPLLKNYHFIRWTNRCYQLTEKNPDYTCDLDDYGTCGLHEPFVENRRYTITIYDCFGGDLGDEVKPGYNVDAGAETIIHEIGHAEEYGRLRLAIEKKYDAKHKYDNIKLELQAATTDAQKQLLTQNLATIAKEEKDADVLLDKALAKQPLDDFKKLTKGKKPLTDYSKKNDMEAFAEAYMLFKVAPDTLRDKNKDLYKWFQKGGYL